MGIAWCRLANQRQRQAPRCEGNAEYCKVEQSCGKAKWSAATAMLS
nr:MAG TPA: hypothetical protein [Caudoviricetes sp.]